VRQAIARVNAQQGGVNATSVSQVLPPSVRITSPGTPDSKVSQAKVEIKASAKSQGNHPVSALRLLVDGRPYQGEKGVRRFDPPKTGEVEATWEVDLLPGKHAIHVIAESPVSKGLSRPVEITRDGADESELPNLYVLAVGISDYEGDMKLHFAASDATLITNTFKQHTKGVFRNVDVRIITDKEATRSNILAALAELEKKMTAKDVAVFSFSGHGTRDPRGQFFLVPVDVSDQDPYGTLVSGDAVKAALSRMPGRVICILDACHSGAIADDRGKRPAGRPDDLVRDLVSDDIGVIVMCSSLGREYSLESPATKAGFFTLGLTEAMSGKADFNADKYIYLHEADVYAGARVRQLSRGKQNPTICRPPTIRSFPLAKVE
jgi:hypothetical protein